MPEAVEARFFVSGYQCRAYDPEATEVTLTAVSRGEHNKNWARATPVGQITMTIKNASAASWFVSQLGAEIAVIFRPADEELPARDAGSRYSDG